MLTGRTRKVRFGEKWENWGPRENKKGLLVWARRNMEAHMARSEFITDNAQDHDVL